MKSLIRRSPSALEMLTGPLKVPSLPLRIKEVVDHAGPFPLLEDLRDLASLPMEIFRVSPSNNSLTAQDHSETKLVMVV